MGCLNATIFRAKLNSSHLKNDLQDFRNSRVLGGCLGDGIWICVFSSWLFQFFLFLFSEMEFPMFNESLGRCLWLFVPILWAPNHPKNSGWLRKMESGVRLLDFETRKLSIDLSIYLPIDLSINLSVCLPACLPLYWLVHRDVIMAYHNPQLMLPHLPM